MSALPLALDLPFELVSQISLCAFVPLTVVNCCNVLLACCWGERRKAWHFFVDMVQFQF